MKWILSTARGVFKSHPILGGKRPPGTKVLNYLSVSGSLHPEPDPQQYVNPGIRIQFE